MVDLEILLAAGLTNLVLPAWPVMLYVVLMSLFVLMHRLLLCLLTTYLFTFYWGFLLYWTEFISTSTYLAAFVMYIVSGLLIAGLTIAASFSELVSKGVDSTE